MRNLDELRQFSALGVHLASPNEILSWSYGEVTEPETINYRTYKAVRDGLFDERIFGPTRDYECACGKYKRYRYKGVICDKCGVEVTSSRVRRERMGHIELASPVVHVWFFRGIPSKLAYLLDISPRTLESVIYFSSFIVTEIDYDERAKAVVEIEDDLQTEKDELKKSLDERIKEIEKNHKKETDDEDFTAKEAARKMNQKVMAVKDNYAEKLDKLEKRYKVLTKKIENIEKYTVIPDSEYADIKAYVELFAEVNIGAEAVQSILESLELEKMSKDLRKELDETKGNKANRIKKRLKIVEGFRRAEIEPSRMVLEVLPVIPPELRPMVQLEGGRFATSDLNDLYRRVINRNNRLRDLLELGAPEIILRNEKRMLQESVDALLDQSKQRSRVRRRRGKQLRSLADLLKGKQGRFRQNLLGKRVDYSGRSVIVNGPDLKLDEAGIPKEMALELFKPFVLRELLKRGYAPNVKSAKFVLDARGPEVWDVLEEVVEGHPVLLNRAPTLWRLGIQAFYPKLVEGNAIRLHLCVCDGYNADFDGDQMAVHLPLTEKAVNEAKELMISTNNLLKPADGSPISVPTKIMLFGLFYLTSVNEKLPVWETTFSSQKEAIHAWKITEELPLRQRVKTRVNGGEIVETTPGRLIFNSVVPKEFGYINYAMDKPSIKAFLAEVFETQPKEVVVTLIDALKDLGLKYGTISGHSVALSELNIPENIDELIEEGRESVAEVENNFNLGLITQNEARRLRENTWQEVTAEVDDAVWENLGDENPIKLLIESKASRTSRDQVKQIAGMRGLISDPTGKLVELPILGNYKNGLSALEYFVSARGARKGLADRALKTADSGYLSRRLVDVSQDTIVREDDCGTDDGRVIEVGKGTVLNDFVERFKGRYLADTARDVDGELIYPRGTELTKEILKEIQEEGAETITIRSPLHCETKRGICTKCYGTDMMTQEDVQIGRAVGVAAAQSIGEPGTQLTMRTFHKGGIAGKDITQGLPRIEEIFEARTPKNRAIMSKVAGEVMIQEVGDERKIVVVPDDKTKDDKAEYMIDPLDEILVKDNDVVKKGQKLTAGHLDLEELLETVGLEATKEYIIEEVQNVYSTQGVAINDKHIEVVASRMFNHVRITKPGDTTFLVRETVTKDALEKENERVEEEGGETAEGETILLGITKAALQTDSFLAAASFIKTSSVLTDAAASGKVDELYGLKENVMVGRLIPTIQEKAKLDEDEE